MSRKHEPSLHSERTGLKCKLTPFSLHANCGRIQQIAFAGHGGLVRRPRPSSCRA